MTTPVITRTRGISFRLRWRKNAVLIIRLFMWLAQRLVYALLYPLRAFEGRSRFRTHCSPGDLSISTKHPEGTYQSELLFRICFVFESRTLRQPVRVRLQRLSLVRLADYGCQCMRPKAHVRKRDILSSTVAVLDTPRVSYSFVAMMLGGRRFQTSALRQS